MPVDLLTNAGALVVHSKALSGLVDDSPANTWLKTFAPHERPQSIASDRSERPMPGVTLRHSTRSVTGLDIAPEATTGVRFFQAEIPMAPLQRAKLQDLEIGSRLQVLQSWEGRVKAIDYEKNEFAARLVDLTGSEQERSEATFDLGEVSNNDKDLLRVGGVFRWLIGYRRYNFGQQERVSAITFRRLPAWHADDLATAVKEGDALAAAFSAE